MAHRRHERRASAGAVHDSVNEGIRSTFEVVPDAPVESFTLSMQGGRKGLIVNSTNLCAGVHRATAILGAERQGGEASPRASRLPLRGAQAQAPPLNAGRRAERLPALTPDAACRRR
jgi:hypothetical protein